MFAAHSTPTRRWVNTVDSDKADRTPLLWHRLLLAPLLAAIVTCVAPASAGWAAEHHPSRPAAGSPGPGWIFCTVTIYRGSQVYGYAHLRRRGISSIDGVSYRGLQGQVRYTRKTGTGKYRLLGHCSPQHGSPIAVPVGPPATGGGGTQAPDTRLEHAGELCLAGSLLLAGLAWTRRRGCRRSA
jgi:hypothetical protein